MASSFVAVTVVSAAGEMVEASCAACGCLAGAEAVHVALEAPAGKRSLTGSSPCAAKAGGDARVDFRAAQARAVLPLRGGNGAETVRLELWRGRRRARLVAVAAHPLAACVACGHDDARVPLLAAEGAPTVLGELHVMLELLGGVVAPMPAAAVPPAAAVYPPPLPAAAHVQVPHVVPAVAIGVPQPTAPKKPPPEPAAEPEAPPAGSRARIEVSGAEDGGAVMVFSVPALEAALGRPGWGTTHTEPIGGGNAKGGAAAVLRARNGRTGQEGGVLLFGDGRGCWNPRQYAKEGDWRAGDAVELLDVPSRPPATLPVARHEISTGTGWNLKGDRLAFGECGVVGDWWKALEVELELDAPAPLRGVWTDAPPELPYTIMTRAKAGADWELAAEGCSGTHLLAAAAAAPAVTAVRLRWESTDMHKLRGLSSMRSGGGLHAELLAAA